MASGVSGMLQHFCSGCQVRPGISLILSIRSRAKGVMIDRRPGSPHRTSIGRAALIGQHAWPPVAPSTTIRSVNPYAVLLGRTAATVRAEMEPVHRSTRACDEQRLRDITGRGPGPFVSRVGGAGPFILGRCTLDPRRDDRGERWAAEWLERPSCREGCRRVRAGIRPIRAHLGPLSHRGVSTRGCCGHAGPTSHRRWGRHGLGSRPVVVSPLTTESAESGSAVGVVLWVDSYRRDPLRTARTHRALHTNIAPLTNGGQARRQSSNASMSSRIRIHGCPRSIEQTRILCPFRRKSKAK